MPNTSARDVGRLPGGLPNEFNSLRRSVGVQRLSTAGSLPSSISGNFNNIIPASEIPYGSIGFTLVCRSASDFTTILGIFYDFISMSFTEELSAPGAGSVSFDLEDQGFLNQLIDSTDPEIILTKDNLWEVYFDGQRRFMWLGQNVNSNEVNESEDSTLTISGPGLATSLDWAKVLPNRFPSPKPKLETLQDDFVDQDLDVYGKWIASSSVAGTISVSSSKLNVSVSGTGTPGVYVASDYAYDFEESGASVRVEPYVASTGTGYIKTYLRIEESETEYVGMFVTKVGSSYFLTAEAVGPSGYTSQQVPYVSTTQSYWRIQERDGSALFAYKGRNDSDDQWITFATLPYSMDPTIVRLRLWAIASAGTGLTLPQVSRFAELSTNGVASPLPPFERFRRLILKAQDRGTIRHIIPDWSAAADSMGAAWVDNTSAEASLGSGLMSILDDYCSSNRTDWLFTSDYRLQLRQRVYVQGEGIPDPTAPYHKENSVIFYEEESQLAKQHTRSYQGLSNYLVGNTASGDYAVEYDQASIDGFQQREELISDTLTATDTPSLRTSLKNQLEVKKDGTSSWSVNVAYNIEGKRLYQDYALGYWIGVQSTRPSPKVDSWRIAAISVQVAGDSDPEIELTLNAKLDPYWVKLERNMNKLKWINPPNPRLR